MDSPTRSRHAPEEPSLPLPSASTTTPSLAGAKRPATSLLPAFEPLSSSPGLPRPAKRQNTGSAYLKYPTPVPTSSTGILSSSPPPAAAHHRAPQRPFLSRTTSERAPLSAVPAVSLSLTGETLMMGRSSNSSHYQLSSNRLVSRVHVKARYIAPPEGGSDSHGKIEIICNGWNGLKLHCQGRTWELRKGDSFSSETEGTDIMVDVQDARVMVQWPRRITPASPSDSSWDDSPRRNTSGHASNAGLLQSSPLRRSTRIESPTSPTPGHHLLSSERLQALLPGDEDAGISIYEDGPEEPAPGSGAMDAGVSMKTEVTASFHSEVSEHDENDPDEENDPIVHSFGPFGGNLSNRLASILSKSPRSPTSPKKMPQPLHRSLSGSSSVLPAGIKLEAGPRLENPGSPQKRDMKREPSSESLLSSAPGSSPELKVPIDPALTNHVINQLAFSRLSSTPLSTIMRTLPAESKQGLTKETLRRTVNASPAIGAIERSGKDAAGKALESEYYYIPEGDDDKHRSGLVVDGLRKPSLRACRKQHKQYYWKRPKTP